VSAAARRPDDARAVWTLCPLLGRIHLRLTHPIHRLTHPMNDRLYSGGVYTSDRDACDEPRRSAAQGFPKTFAAQYFCQIFDAHTGTFGVSYTVTRATHSKKIKHKFSENSGRPGQNNSMFEEKTQTTAVSSQTEDANDVVR
jgi:hypothetical protein